MSRVRRPRVARVTAPVNLPVISPVILAVTLAVTLAGGLLAACSDSADSSSRPESAPSSAVDHVTQLDDVDTTALVVPREPFCDRVDPAALERALGEAPADVSAYRSGQRVRISDDVADVVHEFGCRWTAGDNVAEAWVFAPPVTRKRAAGLARAVERSAECADRTGPEFGDPWGRCLSREGAGPRLTYGGLFGDAWLGCSLTLPEGSEEDAAELGQEWCAAVAMGAASAD